MGSNGRELRIDHIESQLGTIGGERFERRAGVVELAFTVERKRGVIAIQLVSLRQRQRFAERLIDRHWCLSTFDAH